MFKFNEKFFVLYKGIIKLNFIYFWRCSDIERSIFLVFNTIEIITTIKVFLLISLLCRYHPVTKKSPMVTKGSTMLHIVSYRCINLMTVTCWYSTPLLNVSSSVLNVTQALFIDFCSFFDHFQPLKSKMNKNH